MSDCNIERFGTEIQDNDDQPNALSTIAPTSTEVTGGCSTATTTDTSITTTPSANTNSTTMKSNTWKDAASTDVHTSSMVDTTSSITTTSDRTTTAAIAAAATKDDQIIVLPNGQEMNSKTTLQSFDIRNAHRTVETVQQVTKNPSPSLKSTTDDVPLPTAVATRASLSSNNNGAPTIPINYAVAVNTSNNEIVEAEPYHSIIGIQESDVIPWYKKKWFYINIVVIALVSTLTGLGVYVGVSRSSSPTVSISSPNVPQFTAVFPVQNPHTPTTFSPTAATASPTMSPTIFSKENRITNYVNSVTLSGRTNISSDGVSPEDIALNWIIYSDPLFNTTESWLSIMTLSSQSPSSTDNSSRTVVTSAAQFRLVQRYALLALWFQQVDSNGTIQLTWNNVSGWLGDINECNWYGINCTTIVFEGSIGEQNVVTGIEFLANPITIVHSDGYIDDTFIGVNLTGTLPSELGLLTHLKHFNITFNPLILGQLPSTIGHWTALTYFNVAGNMFTGSLPSSIGQWTSLTHFDISYNKFIRELPLSIGQWTALTYFDASRCNELTGTLPSEIGLWTALKYFYASSVSGLTGTLPSTIGQWTALEAFHANDLYGLTGTLPSTIGKWTALTFLNFASCVGLTGTLPPAIGQWTALRVFNAYDNSNLVGTIPSSVGQWTALSYFVASYCFGLTGTFPSTIGQWTALEAFIATDLSTSMGPLPSSIGQWTALTYLDISYNLNSIGILPSTIGQWTALQYFDAQSTFNGTLPTTIGQWTSLIHFDVNNARLEGTLPSSIGQWTAMTFFNVAQTETKGKLPFTIGNWTSLQFFNVEGNELTGTVPSSIVEWNQIVEADFDSNTLTGSMPDGVCTLVASSNLTKLEADCRTEIVCSCCTRCA